jgi:hypothetical protein
MCSVDSQFLVVPALSSQVRINANLRSQTVNELHNRKRAKHLAAFDYLLVETNCILESELEKARKKELDFNKRHRLHSADSSRVQKRNVVVHTVNDLLDTIKQHCSAVRKRHAEVPSSRY